MHNSSSRGKPNVESAAVRIVLCSGLTFSIRKVWWKVHTRQITFVFPFETKMAHYGKVTFSAFAKLTLQSLKNDNLHILDGLDFSMLLC